MNNSTDIQRCARRDDAGVATMEGLSSSLMTVPAKTQGLLLQMFSNPRLLEKNEVGDLVHGLRECVAANPRVSELRVLLGMALCVNLEVQEAMEELGESVRLAPDSYIAHLKMGELWMRLRVCDKAADHTHVAEKLARNAMQAELARKQAAALRVMRREGIERGGTYKSPWRYLRRVYRFLKRERDVQPSAVLDVS